MSESEWGIEAYGLTKVYSDFWGRPKVLALDKLDLRVARGEVFGLLGPNGSGKTTSAKLFLGLLWPSSGTARLLGHFPRDVEIKRKVGYLPEESYFYRFLSGRETIDFYARFFGIGRVERRRKTDALLDMVGLAHASERKLSEYSKGMLRRVGLAQALINDPQLVVLDEPTSGLDPIGTRQVKDLVLELKEKGSTVVLNSHLLAEMEDVCDRVAILHNGQLRSVGALGDLLERGDVDELQFSGLQAEEVDALVGQVSEKGGNIVSRRHPRRGLEEFFLEVIAKGDGRPEEQDPKS